MILVYTVIFFFSSNPISRKGYLEFCEQDTTWHKKYVVSASQSRVCTVTLINSLNFDVCVGYKKAVCTDLQQ